MAIDGCVSNRPLRVLIDATALPADRRGVGTYLDAMLPELDALGSESGRLSLIVVCQPRDADHYADLCPHADVLPAPRGISGRPARLLWEQSGFAGMIARTDAEVVHSPHYTMALAIRRPTVVTLHDATFFSHPDTHQPAKRTFFIGWIRTSLRRARRCIVPSAATRDEIARYTGVAAERMDVVHLGVDRRRFHVPDDSEIAAARESIGLPDRPYIAFLGTLEPRKNVPALIDGYAAAFAGESDPPALVVAGGSGWDDTLDAAVARVRPPLQVIRPGYLPVEALSGYLGGALVVAYPSLGEGFGLPVLEGMACGAAVLTTRNLALPEVGGDAVEYCDTDAASIASRLRALAANPNRRADLGRAGVARASHFSWRNVAERHLEIYEEAAT